MTTDNPQTHHRHWVHHRNELLAWCRTKFPPDEWFSYGGDGDYFALREQAEAIAERVNSLRGDCGPVGNNGSPKAPPCAEIQ